MICNYLIINYMYNKNHIPILYTEVLCCKGQNENSKRDKRDETIVK